MDEATKRDADQDIRDEKADAERSLHRMMPDSKGFGRATKRLGDATDAAADVPARRHEPRPDQPL